MTTSIHSQQNVVLREAICDAVSRLEDEKKHMSPDGRTGYIDAPRVRSIVYDVGVVSQQELPQSFSLLLPQKGAPYMSREALTDLIEHMRTVARAL